MMKGVRPGTEETYFTIP